MARTHLKYKRMFLMSTSLFIVLFLILFLKEAETSLAIIKYDNLVTFELHPFWKAAAKEQLEGEKQKKDKGDGSPELLVNSTAVKVTREELGRNSWQLLHMISGTVPDTFDESFRFKINSYLNLL